HRPRTITTFGNAATAAPPRDTPLLALAVSRPGARESVPDLAFHRAEVDAGSVRQRRATARLDIHHCVLPGRQGPLPLRQVLETPVVGLPGVPAHLRDG